MQLHGYYTLKTVIRIGSKGISIIAKTYALTVHALCQLRREPEALTLCQEGRRRYPEDLELQFLEGGLLLGVGKTQQAEACFHALMAYKPGSLYSGIDLGLVGYKTHHNLGVLYQQQNRHEEAVHHWQRALAANPEYRPAWLGLGELYVFQKRWLELEKILQDLQAMPKAQLESTLLRARFLAARGEMEKATTLLQQRISEHPQEFLTRLVLSQILVKEGKKPKEIEASLHAVLALQPSHGPTLRQLAVWAKNTDVEP